MPRAGMVAGLQSGAAAADATSRRRTQIVDESPADVREIMPQVTFRELADDAREMSETVILALRLREGLDISSHGERAYGH